jgi:Protein of unknown function (DUF2971)
MPIPVSQQYPELMHYTTLDGLRGILTSGCLWATDASFLNDSSEITHFFDTRLGELIYSEVRKWALEIARDPAELARIVADGGLETVVSAEASEWTARIRFVTLAMNKPYVLSLSGPSDERVKKSGLLSQWRGYSGDGGYAIVLDTRKLEELMENEAKSHHYMHVQIGDVYYHGIDPTLQSATPDVAESEEIVKQGVSRLIRGGTAEDTKGFYAAVTALSCLWKHWGFWEEREVRLVFLPVSEEVDNSAVGSAPPRKEIKTRDGNGLRVPYIELFAQVSDKGVKRALPILRVIVGPHRDRGARAQAVRELLLSHGYSAEVIESEIPYLGR